MQSYVMLKMINSVKFILHNHIIFNNLSYKNYACDMNRKLNNFKNYNFEIPKTIWKIKANQSKRGFQIKQILMFKQFGEKPGLNF